MRRIISFLTLSLLPIYSKEPVHARHGITGERKPASIGFAAGPVLRDKVLVASVGLGL